MLVGQRSQNHAINAWYGPCESVIKHQIYLHWKEFQPVRPRPRRRRRPDPQLLILACGRHQIVWLVDSEKSLHEKTNKAFYVEASAERDQRGIFCTRLRTDSDKMFKNCDDEADKESESGKGDMEKLDLSHGCCSMPLETISDHFIQNNQLQQ